MKRKQVTSKRGVFTSKEKGGGHSSYHRSSKRPRERGLLDPKAPLLKDFLAHMQRRGRARETQRNRMMQLGRFLRWLKREGIQHPGQASERDLERFSIWLAQERVYRGRRLGPRTRGEYITGLRSFYRFLKEEGQILTDPAAHLGTPKAPKRIHRDILSVEETWQLLDGPDARMPSGLRDHVAMRILVFTGLRAKELTGLRLPEVDLEAREIVVRRGKGGKDRLVFFDTRTRVKLSEYLVWSRPALVRRKDVRALIVNDSGLPISADSLRDLIAHHTQEAGIGKHLTCHSLRRTFCTLLLQGGCNLKAMSDLAGHERLSTTARYTRIHAQELAAVYQSTHPRSQT